MVFSYVARQPILDRNKNLIAYELLFRDGPNNAFPGAEPDLATSRLLSEQFFCVPNNALGNKIGFVNFPYQSLINQVPTLFPKKQVVIEVLEDCPPTDLLLSTLQTLKQLGYTLALDDFIPSKEWERFLPYIDIIKFDLRQVSIEESAVFIQRPDASRIKFLAEKVETYQEFQDALAVGFVYFQGFFFSEPEMIKRRAIRSSLLTITRLCTILAQEDINYTDVEKIIVTDVTLSYKLLRFVNSSANIISEVTSFRQAMAYLGQKRLRKFIALTAIASTQKGKPDALYSLSIQRARFAELIAKENAVSKSKAFLMGMFSLLDSLLDQPLDVILNAIAIDKEIKAALLVRRGELGDILSLVIAYEKADWQEVKNLSQQLNYKQDILPELYQHALHWTDELFVQIN